ncbi:hypothetical protein [Burkholderia sp. FL-7-2-10-S1-D7]|uniref:hypothetical protein n=1 Tax=Burkholderia sp. FL-7-2-10-S1-D7 TaxID=1637866 RepID=UPI0012E3B06A|nr:hypothetical protein [Burkholderia sp. FL-7-2-10-S1-D7]
MAKPIPADLRAVMRVHYDTLIDFVLNPSFKALLDQLYDLPIEDRPEFVRNTILNPTALADAGIDVPDGILIQRSSFGDGRPTLFVVKRYLPPDYQVAWENVNLTFDLYHTKDEVLQGEAAWKTPIPVEVQAALYAMNATTADIVAYNGGNPIV